MRTERKSSERRKPTSYLSGSKNSALIPQSLVLCIAVSALLFVLCFFTVLLFPPCSALLAPCSSAWAQQTGKVFRIGFLDNSTASGSAVLLDAFRQELRTLGWIEEKN